MNEQQGTFNTEKMWASRGTMRFILFTALLYYVEEEEEA